MYNSAKTYTLLGGGFAYTPRHSRGPVQARFTDRPIERVFVLIPAWNEEDAIASTLRSVFAQTVQPIRVVVVVNNTTDNTAAVAKASGADVIVMEQNKDKKAGALNYALDLLEPWLTDEDAVLVMDADTTLQPTFVEAAIHTMNTNRLAGGVSSIFVGRASRSILGNLQQMEYFRYRHEIRRNGDRAFVLSGTASLIRYRALVQVREARRRGVLLPSGASFYDTVSLTEDNELTLALQTLGWTCPAPGATSTTDVMETPSALFAQRRRWYLGALGNLHHYGWKLPWYLRWVYWRQQIGLLLSVLVLTLVMTAWISSIALHGVGFSGVLAGVMALYLVERVVSVWRLGWRYRIIAAAYVPELCYSIFLLLIFTIAVGDQARGHQGSWHRT